MAKKKTLTDRGLKGLKAAPAGKRYDVMDTVVPGFGVRVTEHGRRTFILVARYPGSSNPTRRAVGEYGAIPLDKARDKARDWLQLIRTGVDPQIQEERERQSELRRQENSFAAIAEAFIADKLPRERKGAVRNQRGRSTCLCPSRQRQGEHRAEFTKGDLVQAGERQTY